jgi:hypothetical protein
MAEATAKQKYVDRPASITADLAFAALVACGAAVLAAILPLNWIPLIGPQAPGIAGGLVGGLHFYRARSNSPLNWAGKK